MLIYDIYSIVYKGSASNMDLNKDIAVWTNIMSPAECQTLIDHYDRFQKLNLTYSRLDLRDGVTHQKQDRAVFLLEEESMRLTPNVSYLQNFLERFWNCWAEYCSHYSLLQESGRQTMRQIKLQKTMPGEGYHQWHYEADAIERSGRIAAWGLYLNTVEQGGETEWLYQSIRQPAVQGSLAIWPAGFTHAHRGNPPLSGEKYLLTGWVEF